jgi:hypothetical protein
LWIQTKLFFSAGVTIEAGYIEPSRRQGEFSPENDGTSSLGFVLFIRNLVVGTKIPSMRGTNMKHVPTTATAVSKIKKAAKALKLAKGIEHSAALDAAARDAGYENFHHVTSCAAKTQAPARSALLGALIFAVHRELGEFQTYENEGIEEVTIRKKEGVFQAIGQREAMEKATDQLHDLLEELDGGGVGDMHTMGSEANQRMAELCESLCKVAPEFLDGYAHRAGALVALRRHAEAVEVAAPVFAAASELIGKGYKGYVPYWYLENRPFHRLAHNLVLAHAGTGEADKAHLIAAQMLKWWPNDNIGFRYLLSGTDLLLPAAGAGKKKRPARKREPRK